MAVDERRELRLNRPETRLERGEEQHRPLAVGEERRVPLVEADETAEGSRWSAAVLQFK